MNPQLRQADNETENENVETITGITSVDTDESVHDCPTSTDPATEDVQQESTSQPVAAVMDYPVLASTIEKIRHEITEIEHLRCKEEDETEANNRVSHQLNSFSTQ